jgi:hypothetical protein
MEKIIGLTFAAILGTAIVGISAAQQKLFNESCSTVSFSMTNGNGLGRSAPVLLVPCHNRAGE